MDTVLVLGILARCFLDVVRAVTYRSKMLARADLLRSVATLPHGVDVAEQAADGSKWLVRTKSREAA